jgi:hypothetical protein
MSEVGKIILIKVARKSTENLTKFECMGTVVTNQNCFREKVKSRSNCGNVCCLVFQNL